MKNTELKTLNDIVDVYEKSKYFAESILDSSSFALIILDANGFIYRANYEAAHSFKKNYEHLPGSNIKDYLNKSQFEIFIEQFDLLKTNKFDSVQLSLDFINSQNQKQTYIWKISQLLVPIYNLKLYQIYGTDVSTFKKRIEENIAYEKEISFEKKKNQRLKLLLSVRECLDVQQYQQSLSKIIQFLRLENSFDFAIFWTLDDDHKTLIPNIVNYEKSKSNFFSDYVVEGKSLTTQTGPAFIVKDTRSSSWSSFKTKDYQSTYYGVPFDKVPQTSICIIIQKQFKFYGILEFCKMSDLVYDAELFETLKEIGILLAEFTYQNSLHTELKLKDAQIVNSAKMSALGEMTGGIAHEINNPLTIITGKVSILISNIKRGIFDNDKFMNELQLILNTTNRITKIIKGMRAFSRNSEGDPFIQVSLNQVIANSLNLTEQRLMSNQIKLTIAPIPDIKIECRESQLIQVFTNLLNNSFDAIVDMEDKWIAIDFVDSESEIQILVTDCGHGIPSEIVDKIMQPFFTTKDIGHGTGLGLSISLGIIKSHKGQMLIDKKCPNTRFVITLPKKQE